MPLSTEERMNVVLLAGCHWCPYRARFINRENIFHMYGDFWIILCSTNPVKFSGYLKYHRV